MSDYIVAALYRFTAFEDPAVLIPGIEAVCRAVDVRGTLLFAPEGLNGTIAGTRDGIDHVLATLRALPGCAALEHKESIASAPPFRRLRVRLKKEIVTMGVPGVDPNAEVGAYVDPADWNDLIAQDDVVLIDTRNDYEVAIGSFEGALDPETESFRAFPEWWQANREKFEGKRVAMFCTGGIRCEKASSYLLGEGVEDVFHLKGGILKYLETVPEENSRWNGACFVFDQRVAVTHGLEVTEHMLCFACRRPLLPDATASPHYEAGVSCGQCIDEYSDADRERFRQRQKQIALARSRGEVHLAGGS